MTDRITVTDDDGNQFWRTPAELLALLGIVHPWGEPPITPGWCDLCWASDGDARCLRCGRSGGGPDACECPQGILIGPCCDPADLMRR